MIIRGWKVTLTMTESGYSFFLVTAPDGYCDTVMVDREDGTTEAEAYQKALGCLKRSHVLDPEGLEAMEGRCDAGEWGNPKTKGQYCP